MSKCEEKKLYDWQKPIADAMTRVLKERRAFVCGAPTGCGKTFIALDAIRRLGLRTLVVTPKVGIAQWSMAVQKMDCGGLVLDVINPEQISKKSGCHYYTRDEGWKIPEECVIVLDEFQRYGTANDMGRRRSCPVMANAIMCLAERPKTKVIVLSATLAETPLKMEAVGILLGLFTRRTFVDWCFNHGCHWQQHGRGRYSLEFTRNAYPAKDAMRRVRAEIGDRFMSLDPREIPDFPEERREVFYVRLEPADHRRMVKAYDDMPAGVPGMDRDMRCRQLRARQSAELCKAKVLAEMAAVHEGDGHSVFIAVNYTETRLRVETCLDDRGIGFVSIFGGQTDEERRSAIAEFQENRVHVLVAMIQAGGVAVSLHDVRHERPRVSLISPGYSAGDLIQAMGRIRRVGGTDVTQLIVLADGTIEQRVGEALARKLHGLKAFSDADLVRK